jgi:3-hydroxyanthranilate 3,4-dioxygenase
MTSMIQSIGSFLERHREDFQPPVCNKMMENRQLKVMFVGGAQGNQRGDYHIEEGEEIFFQRRGRMCVKVMEKGRPRDVFIEEGEIFLLPSRIPHSPQRYPDTMGLVLERERLADEIDGLRYYTKDFSAVLYEEWFHCIDLGVELKPVIERFFSSDEYKSGIPKPSAERKPCPVAIDVTTELTPPVKLAKVVEDAKSKAQNGDTSVFSLYDKGEFRLVVLTPQSFSNYKQTSTDCEVWLWQWEGSSSLSVDPDTVSSLNADDCLLLPIPKASSFHITACPGILIIITAQPPSRPSNKTN